LILRGVREKTRVFKRDIIEATPSSRDQANEGVREGVIRAAFCFVCRQRKTWNCHRRGGAAISEFRGGFPRRLRRRKPSELF